MTRPIEWQASPYHVRVFFNAPASTSTVLSRERLDRAKRLMVDHPTVTLSGITLDEADIDAMRTAMTESYQRHMQDQRIDASTGRE